MLGTTFYDVRLVVLVLLGASLCMAPVFIFMRMARRQKEVPAVVSSDAARRHMALIYLIRGGEALLVIPGFLLILLIGLGFVTQINPFRHPQIYNEVFSVIMLIIILLVSARMISRVLYRFPISGCEVFEKFQQVNANSVSNFAFIFAAFSAHDFYQLMPPKLPKSIPGISEEIMPFLNRDILWIILLLILWSALRAVLGRILELNTPASPQNPPPIDPDAPEFPRKSPLVQL